MNPIKALFKNDYALIAMIIGAVLASFKTPYTLLAGCSFMLAAFDAQGYFKTLQRREIDITEDKELIGSYRILQLSFQCLLLWIGFIFHSFPLVAALLVWHFSGINDLLYYWFLKQRVPAEFSWLWWTPAGFIYEILLKRSTPRFVEYIQAIFGLITSVSIIYLF